MGCGGSGGGIRESSGGAYSCGSLHPGLRLMHRIIIKADMIFNAKTNGFIIISLY